jgi:hypothetical protein
VAYYHPHKGFYWAKPTSISAPTTVNVEPLPLYTHPPQRPGVGLTDDEIKAMDAGLTSNASFYAGALWADAKLKEKNT